MAMFEVCAKCGHVGRGRYVDKVFAVIAANAKEAARIAREIPRVKHHRKDAIRYVLEIDQTRFQEIIDQNCNDNYFVCHNVQEQRVLCELDIVDERHKFERKNYNYDDDFCDSSRPHFSGKNKIRKPHKYYKYYEVEDFMVA